MNNSKSLATAITLSLGAASANSAVIPVALVSYGSWSNGGFSNYNITSSTATWEYDDVTGVITQSGGTFNARASTSPTTTLFRHTSTGLSFGGGAAASATTWSCLEGNFGAGVGASICGNYNFGANLVNQSTVTWEPGTVVARNIGGDDIAIGPQQSVADLNGITTLSWIGTTLTLTNRVCTLTPSANCTTIAGGQVGNKGYQMVFNSAPVPIPAAAWLFGGALGALGILRRKALS